MTKQRAIENSDLWAAIRGVGMMGMPLEDLRNLINEHSHKKLFASRVLERAARQVIAMRRRTLASET